MARVVVVGGGISGLAAAYRLQERLGQDAVTVLERGDRPGGTLWTLRRDGFQVEMGANGFLDSKPSTLTLCRDLGLSDRLVPASEGAGKNRYLFLDGRLRRLPGSLGEFLRTDLLSWRGKLSLLWERFRRAGSSEQESIDAFARRRGGNEAAEVFADALVTGIYAGDPRLLSLPACFPRIAALERDHGSVLKGLGKTARARRKEAQARGEKYERPGKMWSFRDGLGVLVETLRDRTRPILGSDVKSVQRREGGWIVRGEGTSLDADVVVLCCPGPQQATMLADVDGELARRVGEIVYNRVVVIALGYRKTDVPGSLDGFGFIAPQRTRRDLLGVQWCSSIFPGRAPEGAVLLRALCGGWQRPEIVDWDDDKLLAAARVELQQAMDIGAEPFFREIIRWPQAIPQYHVGHLERVAWIEERTRTHPGLFLGGTAYRGVALNDCTEQAAILTQQVQVYLATNVTGP